MSHEIVKRYKVITARSAEDITNEINYFCNNRKIDSVTVNAASTNLEGTGLRSSNYGLTFFCNNSVWIRYNRRKNSKRISKIFRKQKILHANSSQSFFRNRRIQESIQGNC